jgi:histidine triad (HIT) family protein
MAENCVFCRIVRNEVPASFVYQDEKVVAFLDIKPAEEGHTLVIPRKHYKNIYEAPDEEITQTFKVAKKIAVALKKAVNAEGITITQQNEKAAHQDVFHLHVHVIPRYTGHRLPQPHEIPEVTRKKLTETAEKIRQFI